MLVMQYICALFNRRKGILVLFQGLQAALTFLAPLGAGSMVLLPNAGAELVMLPVTIAGTCTPSARPFVVSPSRSTLFTFP